MSTNITFTNNFEIKKLLAESLISNAKKSAKITTKNTPMPSFLGFSTKYGTQKECFGISFAIICRKIELGREIDVEATPPDVYFMISSFMFHVSPEKAEHEEFY